MNSGTEWHRLNDSESSSNEELGFHGPSSLPPSLVDDAERFLRTPTTLAINRILDHHMPQTVYMVRSYRKVHNMEGGDPRRGMTQDADQRWAVVEQTRNVYERRHIKERRSRRRTKKRGFVDVNNVEEHDGRRVREQGFGHLWKGRSKELEAAVGVVIQI